MTIFELEEALVEFITQNTSELRFRSNEQTGVTVAPRVYSGYVPRNEVGEINAGDISTYPAIIVSAQSGNQAELEDGYDEVTTSITIGCFDDTLDQQGYKDCVNLVQRLKDRFCEVNIIRERFPVYPPITWRLNPRGGPGMNSYPYFFAEMTVGFGLPVYENQFTCTFGDGDITPGRFNTWPEETVEPLGK